MSLTIGFSLPNLLDALVFTGDSDTPAKALVRYMDTAKHLVDWHVGDVFNPTTAAYKSVQAVRNFHASVRKDADKAKYEGQTNWINACDMGLVQVCFR